MSANIASVFDMLAGTIFKKSSGSPSFADLFKTLFGKKSGSAGSPAAPATVTPPTQSTAPAAASPQVPPSDPSTTTGDLLNDLVNSVKLF